MNDPKILEKLDTFFEPYKKVSVKKGKIVIDADAVPDGIYYLHNGVVRRYSISRNGIEATLNIYKEHSFFPLSYAFNKTVTSHFFQAMTDCTYSLAPHEDVVKFLEQNNDVMIDLVKRLYSGLEGLLTRMEYLMSGDASDNIIIQLLILARRFAPNEVKQNQTIVVEITHAELAAQAGVTRETVTRELTKLQKLGLVDYQRGSLTILNFEKLEDQVSF